MWEKMCQCAAYIALSSGRARVLTNPPLLLLPQPRVVLAITMQRGVPVEPPAPSGVVAQAPQSNTGSRSNAPDDGKIIAVQSPRLESRTARRSSLNPFRSVLDHIAKRNLESVVNDIKQSREHHLTSIFERHEEPEDHSHTEEEIATLVRKCGKLLDYSRCATAANALPY